MAIAAKRFDEEFFGIYPYSVSNPKIYPGIPDVDEDVIDLPLYQEIVEHTLPDATGAGRTIQIVLGQYEDVKKLVYETIDDDVLDDLKTLVYDSISDRNDFVYSPDDGTTLYKVRLFGDNPFIIRQGKKAGQRVEMQIIIKGSA